MAKRKQHKKTNWGVILALGSVWLLVLLYAVPFFWQEGPDSYPLRGARGLVDGLISGPLLIFSFCYAVCLSFPRFYTVPVLYFGAGVFAAVWVCLSFYVANSAFAIPAAAAAFLIREGSRLNVQGNKTRPRP